jgi:ubiquinone/menaquinone biosynthesis C-methylase UbiE
MKKTEKKLSEIYHPSWKKFDSEQKAQAISLFAGRLKANGFDLSWFKGKVCLDAGCGSGRYVQAMLDLGAKKVVGVDLNTDVAKKAINSDKVELIEGDIRKIPFDDGSFDFVCCNGVLHHTENPDDILKEFKRLLKKEGCLFLYVFDKETRDWDLIDEFRKVAGKVDIQRMKGFLVQNLGLPPNKLFQFTDLLYAPIQLKFSREELKDMLKGFEVNFFNVPYTEYDSPKENRLIAKKID